MSASTGRSIADVDVPLDDLIDQLRACQPGPQLAEQRHQWLDIDPDLAPHWDGAAIHTGRAA